MGKSKNFLIIPSQDIQKWVRTGSVADKKGNSNIISLFVYPDFDNERWLYRNKGKEIDLTPYWNNFELLRNKN